MTNRRILTDNEVIEAVLAGERDAFGQLVERYQKGLVTYIYHMIHNYEEALELSQDVFIKVFRSLERFDGTYKFSTWLYRIASNHTIDSIRKRKMDTSSIDERENNPDLAPFHITSGTLNPDEAYTNKVLLKRVKEALEELPPSYRELILLRHFNYRSYEAMAKITGLPLGTVKNRIFRARKMLMKKLGDLREGREKNDG